MVINKTDKKSTNLISFLGGFFIFACACLVTVGYSSFVYASTIESASSIVGESDTANNSSEQVRDPNGSSSANASVFKCGKFGNNADYKFAESVLDLGTTGTKFLRLGVTL